MEVDNIVKISDDISLELVAPTFHTIEKLTEVESIDDFIKVILTLINSIIYKDNVIYIDDVEEEEALQFLARLSSSQYKKIKNWLNELPTLEYEQHIKCPHCKAEIKKTFRGIGDFF